MKSPPLPISKIIITADNEPSAFYAGIARLPSRSKTIRIMKNRNSSTHLAISQSDPHPTLSRTITTIIATNLGLSR